MGHKIKPGQVWICKSQFNLGLVDTDIFAKVLKVSPERVFIIRKTNFGFKDLMPAAMDFNKFIGFYDYVGEIKDNDD